MRWSPLICNLCIAKPFANRLIHKIWPHVWFHANRSFGAWFTFHIWFDPKLKLTCAIVHNCAADISTFFFLNFFIRISSFNFNLSSAAFNKMKYKLRLNFPSQRSMCVVSIKCALCGRMYGIDSMTQPTQWLHVRFFSIWLQPLHLRLLLSAVEICALVFSARLLTFHLRRLIHSTA